MEIIKTGSEDLLDKQDSDTILETSIPKAKAIRKCKSSQKHKH